MNQCAKVNSNDQSDLSIQAQISLRMRHARPLLTILGTMLVRAKNTTHA